jgi:hypothetical protein
MELLIKWLRFKDVELSQIQRWAGVCYVLAYKFHGSNNDPVSWFMDQSHVKKDEYADMERELCRALDMRFVIPNPMDYVYEFRRHSDTRADENRYCTYVSLILSSNPSLYSYKRSLVAAIINYMCFERETIPRLMYNIERTGAELDEELVLECVEDIRSYLTERPKILHSCIQYMRRHLNENF